MEPNFKIVLINHSFQIDYFSRRWELFAEKHKNVDVTLFAPVKYGWYKDKSYSYDGEKVLTAEEFDKGNFHKRLFRLKEHRYCSWTSPDFKNLFNEIKPDIVYHIGTHNMMSLVQILQICNNYLPNCKKLAFSMRGPSYNLKLDKTPCSLRKWISRRIFYYLEKLQLKYVLNNIDAMFCHYPDAFDCFRQEGYMGPLFIQTQVGVNKEWFHEDSAARKYIRGKYNLGDSYVFGSASRFSTDKGIDDIVNALPSDGNWKYLMMGTGSEDDIIRLKTLVQTRGLQDKVIMTGFVDWYDISKYWNAVDCAIHVPHTTPHWEDTFSLSAIQPQITGKPIIGDDSGSIPYQIEFEEMIVPEGDINALSEKIKWVLYHREEAAEFGKKMFDRVDRSFTVQHLNDMFYDTLLDILKGTYDKNKIDMADYTPQNHGYFSCKINDIHKTNF